MKPLQIYCPFGPSIGYAELPKELINDFNEGCDNIVKDKELSKSADHSHALVGHVEQELLIPKDIINKWGKWFGTQVREYVDEYFNQFHIPEQKLLKASKEQVAQSMNKIQTDVLSAWYIRSFAGDYNPVHTHTGSQLTCVGYLKVPDLSEERKKGPNQSAEHGAIEIMNSTGSNEKAHFENDRIVFTPKVGNWYLFPANLRHVVYPFRCDGERRSFSINMNTNMFRSAYAQNI